MLVWLEPLPRISAMLQPTEVLFVKYLVTISGRAVVAIRVEDPPETSYTGNTIMKFLNVLLNVGDGYDSITGVFTAPVAGPYHLMAQLCVRKGKTSPFRSQTTAMHFLGHAYIVNLFLFRGFASLNISCILIYAVYNFHRQ